MHQKYTALVEHLKQFDRVGICLSGGSSSALVAIAAVEALGQENVVAITANTPFFTGEELLSSKDLCRRLGLKLHIPNTDLLSNAEVVMNGPDRCYHCKRCIVAAINNAAVAMGIKVLLDGSCASSKDFVVQEEQNKRALSELGIHCPLRTVGITRSEVKDIMTELSMGYYLRPENACLATRIPYGEQISIKKLRWIRAAENYIRSLGYGIVRVRVSHGAARVEVGTEDLPDILEQKDEVITELKEMGFVDVTIDEEGFKREVASCL
ncbi:MAG: ATP-dependent sacrificial sulfur transferase LarE [Clostridia bacterium]|nr:ATP-dependent sacrificial sulfur transferase LarE [Clostridia bacterium]